MLGDSRQVCLSESTCLGAAGDKGSELKEVANWWVSVKPISNFTLIWKVRACKFFRKAVIRSEHIKGNHYAVSLGRKEAEGHRPLTPHGTWRFPGF